MMNMFAMPVPAMQMPMACPGIQSSTQAVQRYVGAIKSFSDSNGYGFIRSREIKKAFDSDVFVHQQEVEKLTGAPCIPLGTTVSFTVVPNKDGRPQARDLRYEYPGMVPMCAPMQFISPMMYPIKSQIPPKATPSKKHVEHDDMMRQYQEQYQESGANDGHVAKQESGANDGHVAKQGCQETDAKDGQESKGDSERRRDTVARRSRSSISRSQTNSSRSRSRSRSRSNSSNSSKFNKSNSRSRSPRRDAQSSLESVPNELPSVGSSKHASGECHACVFYTKERGCKLGQKCDFCHLCTKERLILRKKANQRSSKRARAARRATQVQNVTTPGMAVGNFGLPMTPGVFPRANFPMAGMLPQGVMCNPGAFMTSVGSQGFPQPRVFANMPSVSSMGNPMLQTTNPMSNPSTQMAMDRVSTNDNLAQDMRQMPQPGHHQADMSQNLIFNGERSCQSMVPQMSRGHMQTPMGYQANPAMQNQGMEQQMVPMVHQGIPQTARGYQPAVHNQGMAPANQFMAQMPIGYQRANTMNQSMGQQMVPMQGMAPQTYQGAPQTDRGCTNAMQGMQMAPMVQMSNAYQPVQCTGQQMAPVNQMADRYQPAMFGQPNSAMSMVHPDQRVYGSS